MTASTIGCWWSRECEPLPPPSLLGRRRRRAIPIGQPYLGAEKTTSPYSISWNTTTAANGTHTLVARARDVNGNTALTAPVTVNVANATAATPAFVQVNAATPQTNQSAVTVAYTSAQVAGDTNILAIGWNNTTSNITSVTDSAGNMYQLAVPPRGLRPQSGDLVRQQHQGGRRRGQHRDGDVQYGDAVYRHPALEYSGLDPVNPRSITVKITHLAMRGAGAKRGISILLPR